MQTDQNKATPPSYPTERKRLIHRAGAVFVAVTAVLLFLASAYLGAVEAASAPSLGTAVNFAVLGGSTVTNTGATVVNGDLGVSPGSAITGFPPGLVVPPSTIHIADAVALQAQSDVTTAYNNLAGQACNINLTGQDLGGLTLTSAVYCFPSTSAQLTGSLTLDAQNNPNAVFIFQIGSTLTTASSSSVKIINGGSACKVFWQVGSSATLGTNTAFKGNILANASITLNTSTSINPGRALARNGAVTMDTNAVTIAGCANPLPPPNSGTQTAVAKTLTAIAATQTAAAPTPTETETPTLTPVCTDKVPPTGTLTGTGTDGLGNKYIQITARDTGSGIFSIIVTKSINAATIVPAFSPGTKQPVIITSTKLNQGQQSTVEVKITDLCNNVTFADPVLTLLAPQDGKRLRQTFSRIPVQEHFISVSNGTSGLKRMRVLVNSVKFTLKNLNDGEVRTLDVASAMTKRSNQITLTGTGPIGSSAFIVIGDSALEQPETLQGFTKARSQQPQANFTWGETDNAQ